MKPKFVSELVIVLLASSMHITWKPGLGQCPTSMCIIWKTQTWLNSFYCKFWLHALDINLINWFWWYLWPKMAFEMSQATSLDINTHTHTHTQMKNGHHTSSANVHLFILPVERTRTKMSIQNLQRCFILVVVLRLGIAKLRSPFSHLGQKNDAVHTTQDFPEDWTWMWDKQSIVIKLTE